VACLNWGLLHSDNSNKLVTKKKKKKKNQQRKGETESEIATQQSELSSERHKKNEQREGPSKNSEVGHHEF